MEDDLGMDDYLSEYAALLLRQWQQERWHSATWASHMLPSTPAVIPTPTTIRLERELVFVLGVVAEVAMQLVVDGYSVEDAITAAKLV